MDLLLDDPNTNFGASDLSSCVFAPNEKLVVAGLFALSELFPNNDVAGLSPELPLHYQFYLAVFRKRMMAWWWRLH